jgi:F-type H+-transporting ATPase subunit epsilon
MVAAANLRVVVVTPETTLLDQPVRNLQFPLFDGQIGVLPGRAPLVGRLGTGVLRLDVDGQSVQYFVDGGFVQIKGSVVTLLTNRAFPVEKINPQAAQAEYDAALASRPKTEAEFTARQQQLDRARKQLALRGR